MTGHLRLGCFLKETLDSTSAVLLLLDENHSIPQKAGVLITQLNASIGRRLYWGGAIDLSGVKPPCPHDDEKTPGLVLSVEVTSFSPKMDSDDDGGFDTDPDGASTILDDGDVIVVVVTVGNPPPQPVASTGFAHQFTEVYSKSVEVAYLLR